VLLLAAGASRRFGSPKALAPLGDRTLIELAIDRARSVVGTGITIILGAHAEAILARVSTRGIAVCRHEAWGQGLAESLKHGVLTIPATAPAALVMLVDQPLVTADDLRSLIDAWRSNREHPAAAEYAGDIGAPCILPRSTFPAVLDLRGDRGAKPLLLAMPQVTRVAIPNAAFDVDTPGDLARLADLIVREDETC
jgi:molybdenum cofactor cytidylyltransferase